MRRKLKQYVIIALVHHGEYGWRLQTIGLVHSFERPRVGVFHERRLPELAKELRKKR